MESDPENVLSLPYWRWLEGQLTELSAELGRVTDERDHVAEALEGTT